MSNHELEEELWDDSGQSHKPVKHRNCGGRVYWIVGEEWRCMGCSRQVEAEDMDMEEELVP
jgi:hypothetical protein